MGGGAAGRRSHVINRANLAVLRTSEVTKSLVRINTLKKTLLHITPFLHLHYSVHPVTVWTGFPEMNFATQELQFVAFYLVVISGSEGSMLSPGPTCGDEYS
jgi:hypothetical protein